MEKPRETKKNPVKEISIEPLPPHLLNHSSLQTIVNNKEKESQLLSNQNNEEQNPEKLRENPSPIIIKEKENNVTIGSRLFRNNNNSHNLIANDKKSFTLTINNKTCVYCKSDITLTTKPIIYNPKCGHAGHMSCIKDTSSCLLCNPKNIKENNIKTELYFLDFGNDINYTRKLEHIAGKQGTQNTRNLEDKVSDLTLSQRNKLTPGIINFIEIQNIVIDKDHLKDKKLTFDFLIELGISISQMYYKINMRQISDLIEIGMTKDSLKNRNENKISLNAMIKLYKLDKSILENKFSIVSIDLIDWKYSIEDLSELGWTMEHIIGNGFDLKTFILLCKNEKDSHNMPKKFKDFLYMKREHILQLKISEKILQDCKWNIRKTIEIYGLSEKDCKVLNIPMSQNKKKTNKPQNTKKNSTIKSKFIFIQKQ